LIKAFSRAHKEVLFFASPFFEAALSGNWSETGRRPESISSVITISQPPSDPGQKRKSDHEAPAPMTFAPIDPDISEGEEEADGFTDTEYMRTDSPESSDNEDAKERARVSSLAKLEGAGPGAPAPTISEDSATTARSPERRKARAKVRRKPTNGPDAVIVLKEERATIFHDFLRFVYPQ
jgi:hypothetical protein